LISGRKAIGILGGMGPEATVDLMAKIVRSTPARRDQDHIPIVVYSDPTTPDRTAYILGRGENPLPFLIRGAKALQAMGADVIAIGCNTAHYFYDEIADAVDVKVLHIAREVAAYVSKMGIRRVLVLATDGTRVAGIYDAVAPEVLYPDEIHQRLVMDAIYSLKAGKHEDARVAFLKVLDYAERLDVDGVILGCTELPVIAQGVKTGINLIDATLVLARAAVRETLGFPI